MDLDLYDGLLGGEVRNGDNLVAPKVHQHGGVEEMFNPFLHLKQQWDRDEYG
jgi:hypothetical protein